MKKLIKVLQTTVVVLIAAAILASVFVGVVVKIKEPDFTFMVISDVHMFLEKHVGNRNEAYLAYETEKAGKLLHLSECIFRSTVDYILQKKPNALLITGDISDTHSLEDYYVIAAELKRLKDAGIDVYVVPGNHDTAASPSLTFEGGSRAPSQGATLADFVSIYADFGYNQAIAKDTNSGSYVVDLNENYRLIAIDADGSQDSDEKTRELLAWVVEQTKKSVQDGKTPLGMIHFPILGHFGSFLDGLELGNTNVRLKQEFREGLVAAGMNYIFTGHMHANDISSFTNENGTLYDIETSALPNYPSPIRVVSCTEDTMELKTEYLTQINPDYLPSYLTGAEREWILSDYQGYLRNFLSGDFMGFLLDYMLPDMISAVIDIVGLAQTNPAVPQLEQDILQLLREFVFLPLYAKDEKSGGTSLQTICSGYGVTIPQSNYKDIADLMMAGFDGAYIRGDENNTKDSTEGILFRYSLYTAFYALADFDLFGRLSAIDDNIADIDLMPAMANLFAKGELDVVDNELIAGIIASLPFVRDNDFLSMLMGLSSQDAINTISFFKDLELMGLTPLQYISAENGTLLIGDLLDELLFGHVGRGIIIDENPPDNSIVFDIKTTTWTAA